MNLLGGSVVDGQADYGYRYSDAGNLLYKEDISRSVAYVYPTQGANSVRPHAVTSIPIIGSFTYDDNGNQKSRAGCTGNYFGA